jgi:hypothetical protein
MQGFPDLEEDFGEYTIDIITLEPKGCSENVLKADKPGSAEISKVRHASVRSVLQRKLSKSGSR